MYDHGFGCEEKHLEDMELSEEFFEKMDELIAEESKKYIKDQIEYFKESSKFKDAKNEEIIKKYQEFLNFQSEIFEKYKNNLEEFEFYTNGYNIENIPHFNY